MDHEIPERKQARIAPFTFYVEAADLHEACEPVREIVERRGASRVPDIL